MNTMLRSLIVLWLALWSGLAAASDEGLIVVAHPSVGRADAALLARLYTGRAIEIDGVPVVVANAPPGSPLRSRFLRQVVSLDDERYIAYWTVRRHVGKGAPPREWRTVAEALEFVQNTPGAVTYLPAAERKPSMNVLLALP